MIRNTNALVVGIVVACTTFLAGSVSADLGEGILFKDWNIRPFVSPSVEYDSNVLAEPDGEEVDDISMILLFGIDLDHATDRFSVIGHFWGLHEQFDDLEGLNHTDFGDELLIAFRTKGGARVSVHQELASMERIDYSTARIESFVFNQAGLNLSQDLTDKSRGYLGYEFTDKHYKTVELLDWFTHVGQASVDYGVTDKSALYVKGKLGAKEGEATSSATSYTGLFGIKSRQTTKIDIRLGAGVMGIDADEGSIEEFEVEAEMTWQATPKIHTSLKVGRDIIPASIAAENFEVVSSAALTLSYTMTDSLKFQVPLYYHQYDLDKPLLTAGTPVNKEEDIYSGGVKVVYQSPADFLMFFVEARYTDQDSSIDELDYAQEIYRSGLTLRY